MTTKTRTTATILLAATLCVAAACTNDTEVNQTADRYAYQGEPIPIEVPSGSMEEYGVAPVTRSGQTSESFCEPLDDDFNMVTTIESVAPDSTTAAPVTRSVLGNGIRFRIVAYRNNAVSTANYAGMADYYINGNGGAAALVNANAALALKHGAYKFVCYSYNTSDDINDGFNGGAVTDLSVNQGMDFSSYSLDNVSVAPNAKGTFTLPPITLQRQCSKLYIQAKSISGNITACSATLTNVNSNSVKWTLGDTDLPSKATGGTSAEITWSNPNAATVNSDAQYLLPNDARIVTLSMNMTVAGKTYTNKTFTIASRSFLKGISYKITVNMKSSTIEVPGISFKIATGNVVAIPIPDTSPVLYKYQFQAKQGNYSYVWNGGDYFNWGYVDPSIYKTSNTDSSYEDVCKKIGSQWRTPNQTEMMQFENCSVKGVGSYDGASKGTVKGYYFGVQPAKISSIPASKDKYVFLPFTGGRYNGSKDMSFENSICSYWSSTPEGSSAYTLFINSDGTITGGDGNLRNNGFPVRCITG